MMMRARRLLSCAVPLAAMGMAPPQAHAQGTVDQCAVHITPAVGRAIPANAPALHYVLAASGPNPPPEAFAPPQGIELRTAGGGTVPVTVNGDPSYGYRIEPATPFAAGARYTLHYPNPCAGTGVFADREIAIGPAAAWPVESGTLRLTAFTGDVRYACFDRPYVLRNHPALRLEITASAELQPFLPVVLFEVRVDAIEWGRGAYGDIVHDTFATSPGLLQRPADVLYATCGRTGEGDPQNDCPTRAGGLAPGPHRLSIPVRILGSVTDPQALAADFTIDCDTGGFGSGGAGGAAGAGGTGSSGGGGCAVAAGAPHPEVPEMLLVLIVGSSSAFGRGFNSRRGGGGGVGAAREA